MIKREFIYHPQSGDRVITDHQLRRCERALPIIVVQHSNGCRHVSWWEPGVCRLSYQRGTRQWRHDATEVIKQYLIAYPGIAWDDKGNLTVVVTADVAWDLTRALTAIGGEAPSPRNAIGVGLLLGGAAQVWPNQHPSYNNPVLIEVIPPAPTLLRWGRPLPSFNADPDTGKLIPVGWWYDIIRDGDDGPSQAGQNVPQDWVPAVQALPALLAPPEEPGVPDLADPFDAATAPEGVETE